MKVKNVIKGHMRHDEIERLIIIDPDSDDIAIYSGTLEKYLNPCDTMSDYKKEVDNMEVARSAINCGNQLFIILK
jgi:hypothetical protein